MDFKENEDNFDSEKRVEEKGIIFFLKITFHIKLVNLFYQRICKINIKK